MKNNGTKIERSGIKRQQNETVFDTEQTKRDGTQLRMGGMPILSKHEEGATVSPHLSYENRLASNLLSVKINFEKKKK